MSDTTLVDRLDLQDTVARIDRAQAETRKFVSEQQKLAAAAVAGAVAAIVSTPIRFF